MTSEKPFALGYLNMLIDAVQRHRKEHYGENPQCFELHPEVVRSLIFEVEKLLGPFVLDPGFFGEKKIMGVEIVECRLAVRQKLIDCKNKVIYL